MIKKSRLSRLQKLTGLGARITGIAIGSVGRGLVYGRDDALEVLNKKTAEKLLETFSEMKGLPMKIGQILSFMDGVIPPEYQEHYRQTLKKLQISAKPHSWEQMLPVLINEYGEDWEKKFQNFEKEPIAAASIGQVYRAQLKDGTKVAVKIQYPDINEALTSDLKNVKTLIKTLTTVFPGIDNDQFSSDFISRFTEELDYIEEAKNQQLFYDHWADDPLIIIPKPIHSYCRKKILVTEYYSGSQFSEVVNNCNASTKSNYGKTLFWFNFHSILSFGLFNGDPHPGNYLFLENGKIVFLDFGFVQKYDSDSVASFKQLLSGLLSGKKGVDLWEIIEETLLIQKGTSSAARDLFVDYFLFTAKPILEDQPFQYNIEFTKEVSRKSSDLKLKFAKKLFQMKWNEPKRAGLSPLVRILFGLNSLLAALDAENDWKALILKA